MSRVIDFLDFVFFSLYIAACFYVFFVHSRTVAIYMVVIMIAVILLSAVLGAPHLLFRLKNYSMLKLLRQYDIIREEELLKKCALKPDVLHQKLYEIGKVWSLYPMVIFIKRYYIFINKPIVEDIVEILNEKASEDSQMKNVIKKIETKYKFQMRAEVDGIIARLREYELFEK